VELTVDEEHLGRSEALWRSSARQRELEAIELVRVQRMILVAPHPDDEVLGAAGLIQRALTDGIEIEVVAVTDGEGSHPASVASKHLDLASIRHWESRTALHRLGWDEPVITRLHLPDSGVTRHRKRLDEYLSEIVRPGDLCVAPWRHDGHPDHDACGASARAVCREVGARMLGYLVWAWHWADPEGADIPWRHCRRLELERRASARKRWATEAFQSQTHPIGPDAADAAVLPAALMRRFWRSYEVYVDELTSA
jgi:LmbE family N-acetylglucosaminyl deacetylase